MAEELERLRSITSTALLVEFAGGRGLSLPSILRHTGIREADLRNPDAEVTVGQEIAVMRNIAVEAGDEPGLGLLAGMNCHPAGLGVLGFALMSCPTFGHFVDVAVRYLDLNFTVVAAKVEFEGSEARLVRDDRIVPDEIRRFALERDFAVVMGQLQEMLSGPLPDLRVELALEPHPIYEAFGAVLGANAVVLGAPRSVMAVPLATMGLPLPRANATMARFYAHQCAELIQKRSSRLGVSGQVRELLIHHGRLADQTRIAADLDISVRTLRRRLADEGTTFRELSTETIGMLAEELLVAGLTVEQVADRLGYSSVSAFTSAFRGWKGQSPGHFGRVHRGRSLVRV
ncbi:AraC family transcriptional regulator [Nocardia uniformis]|uniref:AraC family transcriptional regulator n=1 Tax=Nocardia uniformis TaxID=53432 RepID=A0A849BWZ6_9NOCA|nr:AraC family transcriptional regulator [Nocardia uniformis]NNH69526.1 AraC family transcriptional regulator [Nocardia uniformis]